MASISKEPNGHRTIQFIGPDKKRRSVRLGKIGMADAKIIAEHVDHLARCWKHNKPPSKQTDNWVGQLLADPAQHWLHDRLAAAGLVPRGTSRKKSRRPSWGRSWTPTSTAGRT